MKNSIIIKKWGGEEVDCLISISSVILPHWSSKPSDKSQVFSPIWKVRRVGANFATGDMMFQKRYHGREGPSPGPAFNTGFQMRTRFLITTHL